MKQEHDSIKKLVRILYEKAIEDGPTSLVRKSYILEKLCNETSECEDAKALVSLLPEEELPLHIVAQLLSMYYLNIMLSINGSRNIARPTITIGIGSIDDLVIHVMSMAITEELRLLEDGYSIRYTTNPLCSLETVCYSMMFNAKCILTEYDNVIEVTARFTDREVLTKFATSFIYTMFNPVSFIHFYFSLVAEIIKQLRGNKDLVDQYINDAEKALHRTYTNLLSGDNLKVLKKWIIMTGLDNVITVVDISNRECIGDLCGKLPSSIDLDYIKEVVLPNVEGSIGTDKCVILWKHL